jgi:hypothetical protein
MAIRQVIKYKRKSVPVKEQEQEVAVVKNVKNNQEKNEETMDERVNKAEEIMNNMRAANHVKVVKKDKGLIERTESSKIVLTEDNRQVLND